MDICDGGFVCRWVVLTLELFIFIKFRNWQMVRGKSRGFKFATLDLKVVVLLIFGNIPGKVCLIRG